MFISLALYDVSMASLGVSHPNPPIIVHEKLKKLPRFPSLLQLNSRVILEEIGVRLNRRATFDDFPDKDLDEISHVGYDFVYFLGVWQTGEHGMKKSLEVIEHDECCKGLTKEAACSSPFAITGYSVHQDFGGDDALLRLRERCHSRGLRIMLDFVPNHMAVDHPWTLNRPELLLQGSEDLLKNEPNNFFKIGDYVFAYGRGLLWDCWTDTVQLNYGSPVLRLEMCEILRKIARLSDGVRCDVAMLLCQDILEETWGDLLFAPGQPVADRQFWPDAIRAAREANGDFTFVAECYMDRERELLGLGFDFCYDKGLYDVLRDRPGRVVAEYLQARAPSLPARALAKTRRGGAAPAGSSRAERRGARHAHAHAGWRSHTHARTRARARTHTHTQACK